MNATEQRLRALRKAKRRIRLLNRLSSPAGFATPMLFMACIVISNGSKGVWEKLWVAVFFALLFGTFGHLLARRRYQLRRRADMGSGRDFELAELLEMLLPGEAHATPELTAEIAARLRALGGEAAQNLGGRERAALRAALPASHFAVNPPPEFTAAVLGALTRAGDVGAIPAAERVANWADDATVRDLAREALETLRPLRERARTGETLLRAAPPALPPETLLRAASAAPPDKENLLRASNSPAE